MKAQKFLPLFVSLSLSIPFVAAVEQIRTVSDVGELFLRLFSVKPWLDVSDDIRAAAFVRLALFFVVFAVAHNVLKKLGKDDAKTFTGKTSGVVAFALAAISMVFLPAEVALSIGVAYATIIAWALIGLTVLGILYFLYGVIKPGTAWPDFLVHLTRIFGLLLVYWVISAVHGSVFPVGG